MSGGFDVRAMMASPRASEWIEAINKLEAELQQGDDQPQLPPANDDIIEAEVIDLESRDVPALPQDEAMSAPKKLEVAPRMIRPGQQTASGGPNTREVVVDGIRTLVVDAKEGGGDDGPGRGWMRL